MDKLKELLANLRTALNDYVKVGTDGADTRRKEFLDTVRTDYHAELWQPAANVGFASGKVARDSEVTTLQTRAEAAEGQLTAVNGELETFRTKHKDLAAVQTEAATKIKAAEDKVAQAKVDADKKVRDAFIKRDKATLRSEMVAMGINKDYADAQVILFTDRIGQYGEDGEVTALQQGSENIPYTVKGDALLKVIAKEILEKTPNALKGSSVDMGAGRRPGDSSGTPPTNMYTDIQKEEVERAKGGAKTDIAAAFGRGGSSMQR